MFKKKVRGDKREDFCKNANKYKSDTILDEERCSFVVWPGKTILTHLSRRYLTTSFGNVETFRVNLSQGTPTDSSPAMK